MEVLLVEDYPALGYVGDTIQVRNGYARNYLIPRGIAVDFGSRRAKEFQHILTGVTAKRARLRGEAEELGKKVSGEQLGFELKVGAGGKAFGSIGVRDIVKQLQERGYALDKKQVRLSDTIKTSGEFEAQVQLHADVIVPVSIQVKGIVEKAAQVEGKSRKSQEDSTEGPSAADELATLEADDNEEIA
jgi:large subunit ribosomal protein L9